MQRWTMGMVFLIILLIGLTGLAKGRELVVYTYDSFVSWGPAKYIEERFEAIYGVDIVFVATGDSGEMLSKLIAERDAGGTPADIFIGIGSTDLPRVKRHNLFTPLTEDDVPQLYRIPNDLRVDETGSVIPYEHGFITLVYDSEVVSESEVPRTFEELTQPRYRDMLAVQDPRQSIVGHDFLMWTIAEYGENYRDYWERLDSTILTITGGWSEAYSLFLEGEVPMVVSYSTDTAYSVIANESTRYRVLLLNDQGYRQILGMGIVNGTDDFGLARAFLDFVLSPEVQGQIPTTEWMFPANPSAELPDQFRQFAVVPADPVVLPIELIAENDDRWLREWSRQILR
ncbi:MAG: thiamine ABC transporter substrate binding subunit [Candidatus Bipolaricaulia bacterium]